MYKEILDRIAGWTVKKLLKKYQIIKQFKDEKLSKRKNLKCTPHYLFFIRKVAGRILRRINSNDLYSAMFIRCLVSSIVNDKLLIEHWRKLCNSTSNDTVFHEIALSLSRVGVLMC